MYPLGDGYVSIKIRTSTSTSTSNWSRSSAYIYIIFIFAINVHWLVRYDCHYFGNLLLYSHIHTDDFEEQVDHNRFVEFPDRFHRCCRTFEDASCSVELWAVKDHMSYWEAHVISSAVRLLFTFYYVYLYEWD